MKIPHLCECCRLAIATIMEPLSLCLNCQKKVDARSLTPREWYNLVVFNGVTFPFLGTYCYYRDGESILPILPVQVSEKDKIPKLDNIKNSFDHVIEFCFFPFVDEETDQQRYQILSTFSTDRILSFLNQIMINKPTVHVWNRCYQIYSQVIKNKNSSWIVEQLQMNFGLAYQHSAVKSLLQASLHCLSPEEILQLTQSAFTTYPSAKQDLLCFPEFRDEALQWLETHLVAPYSNWGISVAPLNLTWSIIETWLAKGRPLSLVAIDALYDMVTYSKAILQAPASHAYMTQKLNDYQKIDSVPAVRHKIKFINNNWEKIVSHVKSIIDEKITKNSYEGFRRLRLSTHIKSQHIKKFVMGEQKNSALQTKFGGQPNWVNEPEWPLSLMNQQPMRFVAQLVLDPILFPQTQAKLIYFFLSDDEEEAGTIILQPHNQNILITQSLIQGPSISTEPYYIETQWVDEPNYVPDNVLTHLFSANEVEVYRQKINANKIGGIPCFLQNEEFPTGCKAWDLVLQLSMENLPFAVNFGDMGTGYIFLSADGKQGKFILQCY